MYRDGSNPSLLMNRLKRKILWNSVGTLDQSVSFLGMWRTAFSCFILKIEGGKKEDWSRFEWYYRYYLMSWMFHSTWFSTELLYKPLKSFTFAIFGISLWNNLIQFVRCQVITEKPNKLCVLIQSCHGKSKSSGFAWNLSKVFQINLHQFFNRGQFKTVCIQRHYSKNFLCEIF